MFGRKRAKRIKELEDRVKVLERKASYLTLNDTIILEMFKMEDRKPASRAKNEWRTK